MAPTVQMETVQVVRPIKVLALVCAIIGFILLVIAIATSAWIQAEDYHQGLWTTCKMMDGTDDCLSNTSEGWIQACAALCLISMIVCIVGIVLAGIGLGSKDRDKKKLYYRIAMYLMFSACACQVVSLIVFPIMFVQDLNQRSEKEQITEWYFAWAYGIAWGAAIFEVGSAILLLIDKEEDEIYYKEKTTYHDTNDYRNTNSNYGGAGYQSADYRQQNA